MAILPAPSIVGAPVELLRRRLGATIFARVAGDEGPQHRERIHGTEGPRPFDADDPIQRVHSDASMFVGGMRALLLQSLHPLAMAAVDQHSGYRGDPWGRLQRTSTFLAETTFGTAADAERAVRIVRAVHSRITGTAPDGRPYAANEPWLLRWVHVAEVDSFLTAHDRFGSRPLVGEERDAYVEQVGRTALALGASDVPRTEVELRAALAEFRPELESTAAARGAARFMLLNPPIPLAMRAPYGVLSATAVSTLPRWARRPLRLPWLPVTEATTVRASGAVLTSAIRWAMRPPAPDAVDATAT